MLYHNANELLKTCLRRPAELLRRLGVIPNEIVRVSRPKELGIHLHNGATVVKVDPQFFRPADADYLVGDYSKAKKKLGWSPKTSFKELVGIMVEHDLSFAAKDNH